VKGYADYKDTGIDWLGEVPKHWSLKKLKYAAGLIKDEATERHSNFQVALENIESWTGKHIETDSDYSGSGDAFESGDVLFNKLRPYLAKVYHAEKPGSPVGELLVLRPATEVSSRFLFYRLVSAEFIDVVDGSTYGAKMPRASWDFIGNLRIPLPSLDEQRALADYLDRKTQQIDALVAKKERLIELLEERRTAVINRAVTKGLDPDAQMQDSGTGLLGRVPVHWEMTKLKYLSQIENSGEWGEKPEECSEPTPVITTADISKASVLDRTSIRDRCLTQAEKRRYVCQKGDILVVKSSGSKENVSSGKGAYIKNEHSYGFSNFLMRLRPKSSANAKFLFYQIKSNFVRQRVLQMVSTTTYPNIKVNEYINMEMPHPPLEEQGQIVSHLDRRTAEIDSAIRRETVLIEKLRELRTSLISEVVTGKIDVRGEAADCKASAVPVAA
jgi:type I restriction enzyme S subunit